MRVAHIITRLILGGAQENTLYNCEDLARLHGDEVLLITGPAEGPEGDLFERAREAVAVETLPNLRRRIDPRRDWAAYRDLRRTLAAWKPDVVHTHSSKAGILGRAAAWSLGVPAVVHTIHGLPFHPYESWWRNRLYVGLERWAARRCHHLIAVAQAMVDQAVAARVAPAEKFTVIPSGMEVETFLTPPEPPAVVRARYGIPADALVIGKIGRLFELKGHDDLLDAAPAVLAERFDRDVWFLFVGGGQWRERLEQRAAALGGRAAFTGLVPSHAIPGLIHAMDVVAHASYREGLARVLPQALIAGKPVVSYDVDGAREVVLPGRTGFLVPAGDRGASGKALRSLLRDATMRQAYGETGRALFADRFRHENMTAAIRRVYEDALDGSARRH